MMIKRRMRRTGELFSFLIMQQFFTDDPPVIGENYVFTKEQAHHARDVVRLNHETVRLVYDGKGYFAECYSEGQNFVAHVLKEDPRINESSVQVTLAMALIRKEKFEMVLQKAAELGAVRIVPFESSRCVAHARKEKADRQKQRWQDILKEGAQQCKRNIIPSVTDVVSLKDLIHVKSDINCAAYENAYGNSRFLSDLIHPSCSVTIVIGPEGGFSTQEVADLNQMGYQSVTFGSRILRAETAAIYGLSLCSETGEKK